MKGLTNSKILLTANEQVYIKLTTNQDNHSGLNGATITISYNDISDTYTWDGSTIRIDLPADTEYSVLFGYVPSYNTPDHITYISESNNIRLIIGVYIYNNIVDLSMLDIYGNTIAQTTANCYVISEAGSYKFPIAYGAAIKNGSTNSVAYTNNGGTYSHDFANYLGNLIVDPWIATDTEKTISSALLSIADTDAVFTNILVNGNYVEFDIASIPDTGANGIISVTDSDGIIMWSWHIWVWPYDLTPVTITNSTGYDYNILPVNLATKLDSADAIGSTTGWKNWYYLFGRPTPLLCAGNYRNDYNPQESYGKLSFVLLTGLTYPGIEEGIKNPTTFYGETKYNKNWFSSDNTYNLWDASCPTESSDNRVIKTVYDPCPNGFCMPNGNTFTGFTTTGLASTTVDEFNVVGDFSYGYYFKRNTNDTTGVFFPATGYRNYTGDDSVNVPGEICNIWTSSPTSTLVFAYNLYFYKEEVNPLNGWYRTCGYSVRPVADEDIEVIEG